MVSLMTNKKKYIGILRCRLYASTFLNKDIEKNHVQFKDGNENNLSVDNLFWSKFRFSKEQKFYEKNPELLDEWNYEKNNGTDPSEVTYGSSMKVWWKCKYNHEWECSPKTRLKNNCPYCSNQLVDKNKSLKVTHPQLIKEWNYTKNKLNSDEVTYGSEKRVWWKCSKNHEWECCVKERTHKTKPTGCPFCAGNKVVI
ncbi:unnamed protein product, partial [marine sediment metagenome]